MHICLVHSCLIHNIYCLPNYSPTYPFVAFPPSPPFQAGFDGVAVDPADAQITTIETIQMPEPVPPEPAQVIVAQQVQQPQ